MGTEKKKIPLLNSSNIVLITGGTKSGKSEFAEYLAKKIQNITYIALSEIRINDKDWQKKVSIHRKRRPRNWETIETSDLISVLRVEQGPLLIDSIGGFVMESIEKDDNDWRNNIECLMNLLKGRSSSTFIVGEQVGLGLVSEYKVGNTYIERIGELQKQITKISRDNWLAINGRAIKIDDISIEIPI